MTNSAGPDQLASSEANWSGSTLFAKAMYIWVKQEKGKIVSFSLEEESRDRIMGKMDTTP